MERYIAFLRGINISGNNKIAMADLKSCFIDAGYNNVITFLNSGNIVFSSAKDDKIAISKQIEIMIKNKFKLNIPVYVTTQNDLKKLLDNVPDWWEKDIENFYYQIIFIIPPVSFSELYKAIGDPNEFEKIQNCGDAIFWEFSRKYYQKTNWWPKTATIDLKNKITIRTNNTIKKLLEM